MKDMKMKLVRFNDTNVIATSTHLAHIKTSDTWCYDGYWADTYEWQNDSWVKTNTWITYLGNYDVGYNFFTTDELTANTWYVVNTSTANERDYIKCTSADHANIQ